MLSFEAGYMGNLDQYQGVHLQDAIEVRSLADTNHPRDKAAVLRAGYGSLRAGEHFALRATLVDPLRRTITIAETLVDVGGHPYFGPPKTRSRRHRAPRIVRGDLCRRGYG
jgi:hypothetical protein